MSGRQITEADVDLSYEVLALLEVSAHTADALAEPSGHIAQSAGSLRATLGIVREKCEKIHDAMELVLQESPKQGKVPTRAAG